ncbi:hypothetical protein LI82_05620 [Methanococcoides methylutens]|uniref:Uncharacterized protein n=1 Tax=Methanococcoides methylutens TaxID=2226 RepID=A0A099T0R8_METMT|nr:hypothetical protein [Methanococcoides methylutens]KGK98775.1 hypothetical protein LI82_05620 [Methanococcoides methylutens]
MGIIDKNQSIISEIAGFLFFIASISNFLGINIPVLSNSGLTLTQNIILLILGVYLMTYKILSRGLASRAKNK